MVLGQYRITRTSGKERFFPVSRIITHPFENYDVAIFYMSQPVLLNDTTIARTVPLARELPDVGSLATVMGWGWTQHGTRSPAQVLRSLDLPITNSSNCNETSHDLNIQEHELCCGKNQTVYTNICHGDSGSPLVFPGNSSDDSELEQIGIAVRAPSSCGSNYSYSVFVSVAHDDVRMWAACVQAALGKYIFSFKFWKKSIV